MKFIRLARGCARTFCACGRLRETITANNSLRDDQIRREKVFVLSLQTCFFDVDVAKLCYKTQAFVHKAEQHNMLGDIPPTENSAAPSGYMTQSEELQSIGLCRAPCIKRRFDFDRKKGGSDRGGRLPMQAFRIGLSILCSLCEHPEPPESCFLRRSDLIGWTSGHLCLMLVLHVSHVPDSGVASRHRDAWAEGGALPRNASR